MNLNIREWPVWDNEFFNAYGHANASGDKTFLTVMSLIVGTLPSVGVIALLDMFFFGVITSTIFGIFITLALVQMPMRMGRIYKAHGLTKTNRYSHWTSPTFYNFPERMKEYYSLSKEDRRLYPRNILEILRDEDLTDEQRGALDKSMRDIYASVQERDEQKRLLARRDVDVSSVLEYMQDAKRGVDIEAKTYKEYR